MVKAGVNFCKNKFLLLGRHPDCFYFDELSKALNKYIGKHNRKY